MGIIGNMSEAIACSNLRVGMLRERMEMLNDIHNPRRLLSNSGETAGKDYVLLRAALGKGKGEEELCARCLRSFLCIAASRGGRCTLDRATAAFLGC